jgi:hypothetical protein
MIALDVWGKWEENVTGDTNPGGRTMDDRTDPIETLIAAPLGWVPASYFGPGGLDGTNGELARTAAPDGRPLVTLTPLEAGRRGVRLVEVTGLAARRAARVAASPEGWAELTARLAAQGRGADRVRLMRGYLEAMAWVPLVRWTRSGPEADPPPREPRERPCVTVPRRADGIAAADWRLQARLEADRRALGEPLADALDLARRGTGSGGLPGGLGPVPETPARRAELRRLLLDAARAARERERAAARRRGGRRRRA